MFIPSPEETHLIQQTTIAQTARTGPFVKRARVPWWVRQKFSWNLPILDFGCGYGWHMSALQAEGYDVYGHDLWHYHTRTGDMDSPHAHWVRNRWVNPMDCGFDHVYASNVFNCLPDTAWLDTTCAKIAMFTNVGGLLLWNYPKHPRASLLQLSDVGDCLSNHGFTEHEQLEDGKNNVWLSMKTHG